MVSRWFESSTLLYLEAWQSWFIAIDLKSIEGDEPSVGSNPTASSKRFLQQLYSIASINATKEPCSKHI